MFRKWCDCIAHVVLCFVDFTPEYSKGGVRDYTRTQYLFVAIAIVEIIRQPHKILSVQACEIYLSDPINGFIKKDTAYISNYIAALYNKIISLDLNLIWKKVII